VIAGAIVSLPGALAWIAMRRRARLDAAPSLASTLVSG
jgi:hypothetical protein